MTSPEYISKMETSRIEIAIKDYETIIDHFRNTDLNDNKFECDRYTGFSMTLPHMYKELLKRYKEELTKLRGEE